MNRPRNVSMPSLEQHPGRHAASVAAARYLEEALAARLLHPGDATLVVSGGTTPAACLQALATAELPWQRVRVTLTDERRVPATDRASNERMVRERLLQGRAAPAHFEPLTEGALPATRLPFAAVLAGMGEDGHFASLFPDAPGLGDLLDASAAPRCVAITTAASPHPRLSLNLSALTAAAVVVLLAFGAAKRAVLDAPGAYPVGALLAQQRTPVRVVWAP